ncbi:MAG: amidohydrolase [Firmicutes bacterium]|nr:amidohydrolase [Bacillota bacterium]
MTVEQILPQVIAWRRQLHMHPEIANEEVQTSQLVAQVLEEAGIQVTRYPDSTAVVGTLVGGRPGRTIALRADMDALPVQEETGLEFCSQVPGKMHACGHDMHVSILVGVASVLAARRDEVPGTVKFIFQPAEEGGQSGALPLVEAGVMEGVEKVFALHMQPELPTGQISVTPGYCTSNSDGAVITVIGKGGHGAHPEGAVDAIVIGAEIVGALQTITSRSLAAQEAGVVTVGTFHAGTVRNIIAEQAQLQLSLRSLTKETQQLLKDRIEQIVQGITAAYGATYKYDYLYGYPAVYNHEEALKELLAAAKPLLGEENVVVNPRASMVGEDFAYYAQKAPGVLFWLGARVPADQPAYPLHNPKVQFNEDAIPIGMQIMLNIVLNG